MPKIVTVNEYENRLKEKHPDEFFTVIDYKNMMSPSTIRCDECGSNIGFNKAEYALSIKTLCKKCHPQKERIIKDTRERFKNFIKDGGEWEILSDMNKIHSKDLVECRCKKCGRINKKPMSDYLKEIFIDNDIVSRYDTRIDIAYYNESEPDINKLKAAKIEGEKKRTKNDLFFLSMAMGVKEGLMTLDDVREVLNDSFKSLIFDNLEDIKFVGDGTYLKFAHKYIEIRPSGTDAKTKAYGGGSNKEMIETYANVMGNYSGDRTELHKKFIPDDFYEKTKDMAMDYYLAFVDKGANNEKFVIPDYKF